MSLSQKHPGVVFVPWFNTQEWETVYNLIYSEELKNWPNALKILKIWKLRTPLLSAGVEGTSILLETLLVNTPNLSEYELSHIYSTALIRFLNLCATNSDKQGTFYKTAMKNELPKWLITLRHEIAHSHKLPTKSMLELSINFCLNWLKIKYWDIQPQYMENLKYEHDGVIDPAAIIYTNILKGWEITLNNEFLFPELELIYGDVDKIPLDVDVIFNHAAKLITLAALNDSNHLCDILSRILVQQGLMLEEASENNEIPHELVQKWDQLLILLFNHDLHLKFAKSLLDCVHNEARESTKREVASLWLKEIFLALNESDKRKFSFDKSKCGTTFRAEDLEIEVFAKPTPYTLNFLKELLDYNQASPQFIEDSLNILSALLDPKSSGPPNDKIFTILDLDLNDLDIDQPKKRQTKSGKWRKVRDCSVFRNLPLGVLPHQCTNENPILIL